MSGELIAFSHMGDVSVTVTKELGRIMNHAVHLQLMDNSKLLSDENFKCS